MQTTATTWIEVLRQRAERTPTGVGYVFLVDGDEREARVTYAELDRQARAIAARLQEEGATDKTVLLLYPPGLEYVAGFFGAIYARAIAVPAYPPDPTRLNRMLPRLESIVADSGATVVLTTSAIAAMAHLLAGQAPALSALKWIATDDLGDSGLDSLWRDPGCVEDDIAFLQYTSGSTGTPKGVILSHANLLHNSALNYVASRHSEATIGVCWLPPYHDMGLIGGILQPVYGGFQVTLMSPLAFLQQPSRWLKAISKYRATSSGSPNFGYDLCVRKATPELVAALDLSSWDVAYNGAEPVRAATLERFAETFAPCGFRREAFFPCYGLAEATLIVTGPTKGQAPRVRSFQAAALQRNLIAMERRLVELDVEYRELDTAVRSKTRDVSVSGAFISAHAPLPPGSRLELKLWSDELRPPIVVGGEVARTVGSPPADAGMGVRFVFTSEEHRLAVERTLQHITPDRPAPGGRGAQMVVACGAPLGDTEVAIVEPDTMTRSWANQVGEIWVRGQSVAQGYWNRPEETSGTFAARLVDSGEGPFLRTGDLGFMREGELFVAGRAKDLIIIRGANHHPQDIELTVERANARFLRPGCGAAVSVEVDGEERLVVMQEVDRRLGGDRRGPGPERLPNAAGTAPERRRRSDRRSDDPAVQAFLPASGAGAEADVDEIIAGIRQAVAEQHELKAYAVVLLRPGSIPKTSSGKVQRHACKAGFTAGTLDVVAQWQAHGPVEGAGPAPHAGPEHTARSVRDWLTALISYRLGLDQKTVDVQQPIARYGLDSLLAIELQSEIEANLGAVLPIDVFFRLSIQELTEEIAKPRLAPADRPIPGLAEKDQTVASPLAYQQRTLYYSHQVAPDSSLNGLIFAARVRGRLNEAALAAAFQDLCDRHRVLRATVSMVDGQPTQEVQPSVSVPFETIDCSAWTDAAVLERIRAEPRRPFDLSKGPPIRVLILARAGDGQILTFCMHHVAVDAWAVAVIFKELGLLYAGHCRGRPAAKATAALQMDDYSRWQRQMVDGPEGHAHWDYWRTTLANLPAPLVLPTDRPRSPLERYRWACLRLSLGPDVKRGLRQLTERRGVSTYTTLLAAYQALLAHTTGQYDLLIGSPMACRGRAALRSMVGSVAQIVAMRGDLSGNPTVATLLARTQATVLDAMVHQDFPTELVFDRLRPTLDDQRGTYFRVMFDYLDSPSFVDRELNAFFAGEPGHATSWEDLTFESLDAPLQQFDQLDLTLAVSDVGDALVGAFHYDANLFERSTIERLGRHYHRLVERIVAGADERLDELVANMTTPAAAPTPAAKARSIESSVPRLDMATQAREERQPTPIEETLVAAVRELLRVEEVGLNDNFFARGGDSLRATQVLVRIQELFHVELNPQDLFEAPTVAGMAAAIVRTLAARADLDLLKEVEDLSESEATERLALDAPARGNPPKGR